jgi:hypothetical protein
VLVKALPLILNKTTVYVASADGVTAVDTTSGATLTTIHPKQTLQETSTYNQPEASAPVLTQLGGRSLILAPFAVTIRGTGTQPAKTKIELNAVDTTSNKVVWRTSIDLPGWADGSRPVTVQLAGVRGQTAVLSAADDGNSSVYAIDLGRRTVRWRADHTTAPVLVGDHVLALDVNDTVRRHLVGFALSGDGTPEWTKLNAYEASLTSAGPDLAVVVGRDYDSGDDIARFYKSDGSSAGDIHGDTSGLQCTYDDQAITVCSTVMGLEPRAITAKTGGFLWQLPAKDANRLVPTVTTVWHGTVYGKTSNGPVMLDARSGADRSGSPGIAPVAVNAYVGLALDDSDVINAFQVAG